MSEDDVRTMNRRGFLSLAAAAGAASLLPGAAAAQTASTPATPPPAPAAPAPTAADFARQSDARALTEILRRRWPDRFTEAQWDSITGDFDGDLAAGKRLRELKFENGDEPDSTFRA